MKNSLHLGGLAFFLLFSPAAAGAESAAAPDSEAAVRTLRPGCAKRVCQRQFAAEKREASGLLLAGDAGESGVSLVMGLGAGAFHGPAVEVGRITVEEQVTGEPLTPPGGVLLDAGGEGVRYEPLGTRRAKLEGPAASFGVSLAQPLLAAAALGVGLEERFTLTALLPFSGGSSLAGVMDFMLVTRAPRWPVAVAIGPSLTVARLDIDGADADRFDEPAVVASGAALLRLDLTNTLPASLDLVGHYGKGLNFDGSYRDLQLALALQL